MALHLIKQRDNFIFHTLRRILEKTLIQRFEKRKEFYERPSSKELTSLI
jgi:hypothetical protein